MTRSAHSGRPAKPVTRTRLEDYPKGARKLILAAERLFGQHGIDNVSLRQIVAAADQANNYAVQHHFGSKEGLVDAIFTIRMAELDAARSLTLEGLKRRSDITPQDIVRAIFMPILEAFDEKEQHLYADFTYQIFHRNKLQLGSSLKADIPPYERVAPAVEELNRLLKECFPEMPADVFNTRYRLAAEIFLSGLNERRRLTITGGNPYCTQERFWQDILQLTIAIYTAPFPPQP
ncbi:MAG: helix-turn-helix domain-containing protein [Porticoccaceae bacterium]